ncbi:hypothetical protein [Acetivibrio saccincola]|uniref:Uncharacterized protein n=2 Tax=Acetivibrio saccincola TaxID=1677857 RepID=A0A2K9E0J2_9FIRM|nr:hypothetical protein [Acetivibrio saccincola]AUG56899.1 hypothetical protein HVS_04820 [Acetivibrio saccincola]
MFPMNAPLVQEHLKMAGLWALSRKIRFPLAEGEDITAHLTKPWGEWKKGSLATGSLNIEQKDSQILKGIKLFKSYSPKTIGVSENSDTIVLNPNVTATVERPVFEDDPLNKKWLNLLDPKKPKVLDGEFTYGGEVKRTYVYKRDTGLYDEDEIEVEGVAKAPFNPGNDRIFINAYIYNGKKDLKPPSFENKIENNGNMYLQKSLLWQSEPYPFDVIRWMCHIDENGREHNWTAVDGQYKRTFLQQNSANIKVELKSPMTNEYYQGRDAAEKGINRKDLYDKAVFATDKEFQRFDYPIKSGYYFNPAGEYKITLETVTYKPVAGKTKDHENLVNALINSFRYETDLIYITDRREAVNINNNPVRSIGGKLQKEPGSVSVMNNQSVNGINLLTVDTSYKSDFEEVKYSSVSGGFTDERWKQVMEGYSESGCWESIGWNDDESIF